MKPMVVRQSEYPLAHKAWAAWRREQFGCRFVPGAYAVPSLFPPTTQAGADAYAETLRLTREAIAWHSAPVPRQVKPWQQG